MTWTPATLTGLVAWYKADTQIYSDAGTTPVTDGGLVQQWNDQSGNGVTLTQGTAAKKPTFRATGLNTNPAVQFAINAGNIVSILSSAEALSFSSSAASMWAAIKPVNDASGGSNPRIASMTHSGHQDFNSVDSFEMDVSPGTAITTLNATFDSADSTASVSSGNNYRVGMTITGTTVTAYLNGTAQTSANAAGSASLSTGTLELGAASALGGSTQLFGYIGEIFFTKNVPSANDISNIDAYFRTRFGI